MKTTINMNPIDFNEGALRSVVTGFDFDIWVRTIDRVTGEVQPDRKICGENFQMYGTPTGFLIGEDQIKELEYWVAYRGSPQAMMPLKLVGFGIETYPVS